MSKKTGGPAYPFEYHNKTNKPKKRFFSDGYVYPDGAEQYAGMTLRDHFASKALQGDLASQDAQMGYLDNDVSDEVLINRSRLYWRIADAMLKARDE